MNSVKISKNLDFLIFDEPVGVCVSGGADSALLLYFILKYTKHPTHIFTFASQEKFITNPMVSLQVVSRCAELTGNYNLQHHIAYGKKQDKENLFELPTLFFKNNTIKKLYTGITKNPPIQITDAFLTANVENIERNPDIVRKNIINDTVYMPWTNLDKQEIFKLYKEHNLVENLLHITRSCESTDEKDNNINTHCGKCWWCKERIWAFEKLK